MREKNQQNKIIDAKMVFVSVEFDVVVFGVGVVTVVSFCPSVGAVGIGANVIQFHLVFGSSGIGLKKVDKQNNVKNWNKIEQFSSYLNYSVRFFDVLKFPDAYWIIFCS